MNLLNLRFAIVAIGFAMICPSCETNGVDIVPDNLAVGAEEPVAADNASNECERQNYLFQGKRLMIEILRCAENPEAAKASISKEDLRDAVLMRFNALNICDGSDCNNAAKDCSISKTTGQVNGTVASCDPTGETCEDSGNMIFRIKVNVSSYAVKVFCGCVDRQSD